MKYTSETKIKIRSEFGKSKQDIFTTTLAKAEVEVLETDDSMDLLNKIFRNFNRVDQLDCDRLERIGYDLPSLSVGDNITFVEGDDYAVYRVESVGFKEIATINALAWRYFRPVIE